MNDQNAKETDASSAASTPSDAPSIDIDTALRHAIDSHRDSIMDEFALSTREREVVNAILNGETRASAAKKLFISERTVKFHLENCYRKLGVSGKNELIRLFTVRPPNEDSR